jgi:transketolase
MPSASSVNLPTLPTLDPDQLRGFAAYLRVQVVCMTARAHSSHVGGGLSMAEILAVLYGTILNVDPARPDWPGRDRFILSKGHACAGLYAALASRGFFPTAELETFYADGSRLVGHVTHANVPGVECSTGSLGHGLSMACGMALAGRRSALPFRVFALLSDGECNEGSTWEAALSAGHHRLDNLTVIVDYNRIQSLGQTKDILDLDPLAAKWQSFGWHATEVDGHSVPALVEALSTLPHEPGRPTCVVARTAKGKGVSFMEDSLLWHYRSPQGDELARALRELEEPGS